MTIDRRLLRLLLVLFTGEERHFDWDSTTIKYVHSQATQNTSGGGVVAGASSRGLGRLL